MFCPKCGKQQAPAERRMPVLLKIFIGIICAAAILVLAGYGMYWNKFIRVPEKAWKEAQDLYESGDYYEAYMRFWNAPLSRAEYHKDYDWMERRLASLLKYCGTLKEGDVFEDYHGREWNVLKKWEESGRIVLGINRPTYEKEESDITGPGYYDFPMWEYYEEGLIPIDGKPVAAMSDELSKDTFGTTAEEAAEAVYGEEYGANPDAQWFYPMMMLDLSFPKENPFWNSVLYGARWNRDTQEFIYGPLKLSISSENDIPEVRYQHLEESYTGQTVEEVVSGFEAAGASDVEISYLETQLQNDGETMVETLLADYNLSDGSAQSTCRFRCWDIYDLKSVLEICWITRDQESYEKAAEIMLTMKLAEKPATEFDGYSYLGYRTHVRGIEEGCDNPISHTHEKEQMRGSRY